MKGRFNLINDVAETFGEPREEMESYIRVSELSPKDGLAVLYFDKDNDCGYVAGKMKGKMIGAIKLNGKREFYKWEPRKEAA
ncbi:MAG TPA: hypothetical protein VJA47_00475 [archaeon]|nr:hypothetical protein [archaeon]